MALIDRLKQLEKELPLQLQKEFEERCEKEAQYLCERAVKQVEDALKNKTYKIKKIGMFKNKEVIKSVSGSTYPIFTLANEDYETPRYISSDGDYCYWVKNDNELNYFRSKIKEKLEAEGFTVSYGNSQYNYNTIGPSVHYYIEWK